MTKKYKVPILNLDKPKGKPKIPLIFGMKRIDLKDFKLEWEESIPKKLKKIFRVKR